MLRVLLVFLAVSVISVMALTSVKVPKYLAVYYGWPSLVQNSNGDLTKASNWFVRFNLVVFGDGIWKTTHGDHANTQTIITNVKVNGTKVFGYVDLGVSTQNLTEVEMKQAVDGWAAMGVNGIFWDDAGYDYAVTRTRQSNMVQYCHTKGLNVIMNAWKPEDVFDGANMQLNANDIYILESYLIDNKKYTSLTAWKTKADKCAYYQKTFGVQMACLSTTGTTTSTSDPFTQAWFGTAIYNFDYFQATDINYSANNNALAFYANPSSSYGTLWQSDNITYNAATSSYTRSTQFWTLKVTGDGSTWGYGTFIAVNSTG